MFDIFAAAEEAATSPAPPPPGSAAPPGSPGGAGSSRAFFEVAWSEDEHMSGKLTQGLKWGVMRSVYSLQRHNVCPEIID